MDNKEKIYIDADDVILNTSEVTIDYLNNLYNIHPSKTVNDLKDWKYKSIYRNINIDLLHKYWETDEFFNNIKVNEDFLNFYKNTKEIYECIIFTQGTKINLQKKKEYFSKILPDIKFYGVNFPQKKNSIDISDGIQIDDNYDNLLSNAYFKILIKNFRDTDYNQVNQSHTNLYIVNDWKDIEQILRFFNNVDVKDLK